MSFKNAFAPFEDSKHPFSVLLKKDLSTNKAYYNLCDCKLNAEDALLIDIEFDNRYFDYEKENVIEMYKFLLWTYRLHRNI